MAITKAERDKIAAQAKLEAAREKESDEQKWIRSAIRDSVREELADLLGLDDDDDGDPKKSSGGNVSFLDGLLGTRKTG